MSASIEKRQHPYQGSATEIDGSYILPLHRDLADEPTIAPESGRAEWLEANVQDSEPQTTAVDKDMNYVLNKVDELNGGKAQGDYFQSLLNTTAFGDGADLDEGQLSRLEVFQADTHTVEVSTYHSSPDVTSRLTVKSLTEENENSSYEVSFESGNSTAAQNSKYVFHIEGANATTTRTKVGKVLSAFKDYNPAADIMAHKSSVFKELQGGKNSTMILDKCSSVAGMDISALGNAFTMENDAAFLEYEKASLYAGERQRTTLLTPEGKAWDAAYRVLINAKKSLATRISEIKGTEPKLVRFLFEGARRLRDLYTGEVRQLKAQVKQAEEVYEPLEQAFIRMEQKHTPAYVEKCFRESILKRYEGMVYTLDRKSMTPETRMLEKVSVPYEYRNQDIPSFDTLSRKLDKRHLENMRTSTQRILLTRTNPETGKPEELKFINDGYGRVKVFINGEMKGRLSNHLVTPAIDRYLKGADAESLFKSRAVRKKTHEPEKMIVKRLS